LAFGVQYLSLVWAAPLAFAVAALVPGEERTENPAHEPLGTRAAKAAGLGVVLFLMIPALSIGWGVLVEGADWRDLERVRSSLVISAVLAPSLVIGLVLSVFLPKRFR
jgi:hypothetical protein